MSHEKHSFLFQFIVLIQVTYSRMRTDIQAKIIQNWKASKQSSVMQQYLPYCCIAHESLLLTFMLHNLFVQYKWMGGNEKRS